MRITLAECEHRSGAVDFVDDSELVFVEIVRFHLRDEQTKLEVSAAN